ncbi:thymidine phosphorylase [Spiroplasma tabanidicola]|uniref:Thymidine phosphorylase n=1 Tax=Spiroplasma tabanidicola TaxID=324079 RepID=A0A6I6CDS4_9MOLU|nr:thymidine phosphorylase [Spiroplasma tabanidicola]QGS52124.1 thymidine phosphorylase [Spiroplasma tabanidicola]
MNYSTIINKKKINIELNKEEVEWIVNSFVDGSLPDYQMSSFLMVIWFNGMTENELINFTNAMVNSGITYDLSDLKGPFADKHSTGGVGDKTSLIYGPLVAYFGVKVSKLSGRGLGQTGGTIDKLESCTGWTENISQEKFKEVLNKVGLSIMGQSDDVVPADKKIYLLRDVTGSVDSIPLIASSIMSKKLVIPADSIELDVKVGSGAFMKNIEDAQELAKVMIKIGKAHNRKVSVMITNMDKPLGKAIGNALEVKEAWDTLHGNGPDDLNELCITAASISLVSNHIFNDLETAKKEVTEVLKSGKAAHILKDFIEAQNGDFSKIIDYDKHFITKYKIEIRSENEGYLKFKSAESLGYLSMHLGAGRAKKEDKIDFSAGIYLTKTIGQFVKKDDLIMTLYTNIDNKNGFINLAKQLIIIDSKPSSQETIIKLID